MGGSASYTGGGGPAMPSRNMTTVSQRMGLPGMEGSGMPMDPRVTQIMQRYGVRMPTTTAPKSGATTPAKPATPPAAPPRQFSWQFPQYSQTWAFTPPTPSQFTLPPLFDLKSLQGSTSGSSGGSYTPSTWEEAFQAGQRLRPNGVNATMDPRTG